MNQALGPQILFKSTSLLSTTFTAATTDIITTGAAHGYSLGDKLRVSSTGTLPGGLAANTDYYVVAILSTTTIKVSATPNGPVLDITSTGSGTHTVLLKSKVVYCKGFTDMSLTIATANSANFTVKAQISDQEDVNFENAASATNAWSYVQNIDNEDGSSVDGNTGITQDTPGTDESKRFAINIDRATWFCLDITSWTAGTMTAIASLSTR